MTKARNFAAAIRLITQAEARLIAAGQKTPEQRATTLRGIYYGTTWSLDYDVESKRSLPGAVIRNAGFLAYTGGHMPIDPRPAFGSTSLLRDLKDSQSLKDGARSVDIGHLLIGLDTRAGMARTHTFPEGGNGLEVVTWMGDLGGGAANLARKRARAPGTKVDYVYHNPDSDYGVTDNLEGDVAAYLVAAGGNPGGVPAYGRGTVADALTAYLGSSSSPAWKNRAADFAKSIGATMSGSSISNESAFIGSLSAKLAAFGYWYAATRWVPTGELVGADALKTCQHMEGAAREVATVFVKTLSQAIARGAAPINATPPYPSPAGPGTCNSGLLRTAAVAGGSLPF